MPIKREIGLVGEQRGQHAAIDAARIVQPVISVVRALALGQRRWDREIEEHIIGGGDARNRIEVIAKTVGQAIGRDAPRRFRWHKTDRARHREFLAERHILLGALRVHVGGRLHRFDRAGRVVVVPLAALLQLRAEFRIVIAVMRRFAPQGADREIERVEREIADQDRRRRAAAAHKIGHLRLRRRSEEVVALQLDEHQFRRKAALPQILGVIEPLADLPVRDGEVVASVAADLVLRQQCRARGAENHAIIIGHARHEADDLGQPLVERIIDSGQHIAAQIPQGIDEAIDRKASRHDHPGGCQQPDDKRPEPFLPLRHDPVRRLVDFLLLRTGNRETR